MPSKTYTAAQMRDDARLAKIYESIKHSPLARLQHFAEAEPRAVYLSDLNSETSPPAGAWYPMLGGMYLVSTQSEGFASFAGAVAEATEQRDKQREKLARYQKTLRQETTEDAAGALV